MTRLSETPWIDPTAHVSDSVLGRYTEVGAGCRVAHATIGKFANIAAHVRIYASRHPIALASLHHFTYRSSWYFDGEVDDAAFFAERAENGITLGNDVWVGHGAVIMPGVTVGSGATIGSNAVVTHDVPDYAIAVGVPARVIKQRFPTEIANRLLALRWWDWPHDVLQARLSDFRTMPAADFLDKYETSPVM